MTTKNGSTFADATVNAEAAATIDAAALSERAMLVRLTVRQWGGTARDKEATRSVYERYSVQVESEDGTEGDAGEFRKHIFGGKSALKKVHQATRAARSVHEFYTLPWSEAGYNILPAAAFFDYMKRIEDQRTIWQQAVEEFLDHYSQHIDQASRILGGLFRQSDYPPLDEARARFSFAVNVLPLPTGSDFRARLTSDQAERVRSEIEARVRSEYEAAQRALWQRLYDVAERAAHSLERYKEATDTEPATGVFRDTLITGMRDLCTALPALNLTGNADLDRLARSLSERVACHEPGDLRQSEPLRKSVAAEAAAITEKMRAFMSNL